MSDGKRSPREKNTRKGKRGNTSVRWLKERKKKKAHQYPKEKKRYSSGTKSND